MNKKTSPSSRTLCSILLGSFFYHRSLPFYCYHIIPHLIYAADQNISDNPDAQITNENNSLTIFDEGEDISTVEMLVKSAKAVIKGLVLSKDIIYETFGLNQPAIMEAM
jgi:hypothetical protein